MRNHDPRKNYRLAVVESFFLYAVLNLLYFGFPLAFLSKIGAPKWVFGVISSVPRLSALLQSLSSRLARVFSSRKTVLRLFNLACNLTWSLGVVLLWKVFRNDPVVFLLFLLSFTYGLFFSVDNLRNAILSDLFQKKMRGRVLAIRGALGSVVGVAVNFAGGRFLDAHPTAAGFAAFLAGGTVLSWIDAALWESFPDRFRREQRKRGDLRELLSILKNDLNFARYVWVLTAYNLVQGVVAPIYVPYMMKALKMSFSEFSYFGIFSSLAGAFSNVLWGKLIDKHGNRPVLLLSTLLIAPLPLFFLVSTPSFLYLIYFDALLSGIFWVGFGLSSLNLTISFAGPEERDQYLALFSMLPALSFTAGSLLSPLATTLTSFFHLSLLPGKPFTSDDLWLLLVCFARVWMLVKLRSVEEKGSSSTRVMIREETLTIFQSLRRTVSSIIKV